MLKEEMLKRARSLDEMKKNDAPPAEIEVKETENSGDRFLQEQIKYAIGYKEEMINTLNGLISEKEENFKRVFNCLITFAVLLIVTRVLFSDILQGYMTVIGAIALIFVIIVRTLTAFGSGIYLFTFVVRGVRYFKDYGMGGDVLSDDSRKKYRKRQRIKYVEEEIVKCDAKIAFLREKECNNI